MAGFPGLFDVDERLKRLSDLGDQLLAFAEAVDFEIFRADLEKALGYSDGAQGGRQPFDPVMMFKILVIQATNNLSNERAEFLINDRLSFMYFLGLGLSDRVPDARTIWLFREKLTKAGSIGPLFERFDATLRAAGYIAMSGQIVDASLIAAPRQRNTENEKTAIKEGRVPDQWQDKPGKLRQKDRDARWTVKFTKAKPREDGSMPPVDLAIPVFGYQNHISIDRGFDFIRKWSATDAAAYEGRRLREGLLDKANTADGVWADARRRPGPITEAACWSHWRRQFFDLAKLAKAPIAAEAVRRIDELFEIERTINGETPAERAAVRRDQSKPLVEALDRWLRQQRALLSAKSDLVKAINYGLSRWAAFTRFLDDGRVCLSNNAAERAVRGIAIGRKNWTFAGSDEGGRRAAAVYTLIETCKLNDVDPQAWLADILARLPDHPVKQIDELLPWTWNKARRLALAVAA